MDKLIGSNTYMFQAVPHVVSSGLPSRKAAFGGPKCMGARVRKLRDSM